MKAVTVATAVMVVIGAAVLLKAGSTAVRLADRVRLRLAGHVARATVVGGLRIERPEEYPDFYALIVDFTTRDGTQRRNVTLRGGRLSFPGRGVEVTVVYRPGDPGWAVETSWLGGALTLIGLPFAILVGALLFGYGLAILTRLV